MMKVLPLVSLLAIGACTSDEERAREARRQNGIERLGTAEEFADSARAFEAARTEVLRKAEEEYPEIAYRTLHVADRSMLDSIRDRFDYGKLQSNAYKAFVTLNRRVFGSIRVGDTVLVPDKIYEDMRAYSVFPQRWFGADNLSKIIVISNKYQSYACYEKGKQVRFASCNTGTERKPTLPGRYAVNWKERLRISSLNDEWKLPFNVNFHLYAGNAFHQFYMPGRPASHSCVRQFMDDAEWLYNWVETADVVNGRMQRFTGTPILIVDMFDYTRERFGPWNELTGNRAKKVELPEHPMEVEEALIPMSQIPPSVRGALPDKERYRHAEDTLRARGIIRDEVNLSPSIEYTRLREEREKARQEKARREKEKQKENEKRPRLEEAAPTSTPAVNVKDSGE